MRQSRNGEVGNFTLTKKIPTSLSSKAPLDEVLGTMNSSSTQSAARLLIQDSYAQPLPEESLRQSRNGDVGNFPLTKKIPTSLSSKAPLDEVLGAMNSSSTQSAARLLIQDSYAQPLPEESLRQSRNGDVGNFTLTKKIPTSLSSKAPLDEVLGTMNSSSTQ